ncbi:MAG: SUMF1/EgtB/PvdO family nonheme iron enzyme [Myxococcota bacterium]|nr:SUMF1/EgtB/PvdO family nonheme iron enzyme [Myxococcota bacterium]
MPCRFRYASLVALVLPLLAFGGAREAPPHPSLLGSAPDDGSEPASPSALQSDADDEIDGAEDDQDGEIEQSKDGDDGLSTAGAADAGRRTARHGGCPKNMVRVRGFCVDRFEAPNRRGAKPLVMQSAKDAQEWCSQHAKRLCTEDEWITACEGEEHRAYPYGSEHVDGRCNDDKPWQKVDEAALSRWPAAAAQDHARALYQATPSGSKRRCVSSAGAYDMTGNVEEWVVRTREHANPWPYLLVGCYWSGCYGGNKPTCHSTNNAHGPEFRFYETGFRCCKDGRKP